MSVVDVPFLRLHPSMLWQWSGIAIVWRLSVRLSVCNVDDS